MKDQNFIKYKKNAKQNANNQLSWSIMINKFEECIEIELIEFYFYAIEKKKEKI